MVLGKECALNEQVDVIGRDIRTKFYPQEAYRSHRPKSRPKHGETKRKISKRRMRFSEYEEDVFMEATSNKNMMQKLNLMLSSQQSARKNVHDGPNLKKLSSSLEQAKRGNWTDRSYAYLTDFAHEKRKQRDNDLNKSGFIHNSSSKDSSSADKTISQFDETIPLKKIRKVSTVHKNEEITIEMTKPEKKE